MQSEWQRAWGTSSMEGRSGTKGQWGRWRGEVVEKLEGGSRRERETDVLSS